MEFNRDDKTNSDVTVPMNLTLNCSMPTKSVEHANNHKRRVGMKELVI